MHLDAIHVWNAIAIEGATEQMMKGNGYGINWEGFYDTALMDVYGNGWRARPDDLSETVKLVMLLGEFMNRNYHARYYAKAQNIRYALVAAYDSALAQADVLVMPTLPQRATKLPAPDCAREENIEAALNMLPNTAPFDTSGHPAMNVPCAMSDSSPIGMMIVGKRYDDATVLRVAKAFEGLGDWKKA
jgi:amidase